MNDLSRKPVAERQYFALSHAQRAIWADMRVAGDSSAYQLGVTFTFRTELEPALARQAVRTMMGRHDAMRLRVDPLEPRQWLEAGAPPPFRLVDVSDADNPEAAVAAGIEAARAQGFALDQAPPFRVELFKLAADHWRMLLLCHHIAFDGVALALAQRDWLHAYRTLAGEDDAGEAPPRSSLRPVVDADAAYESSPRYEEDIAWWRERLASPPPPLFVSPAMPDAAPDPAPVRLDAAAQRRLEEAAAKVGATWHQALTALYAITLARRYGRDDLTLGMALHRRDAGTRHVIGCLAGLMALRCRLTPATALPQAVAALAGDLAADLRRQRAPADAVARSVAAHERGGLFDAAITIMPDFGAEAPMIGGRLIEGERLRFEERSPLALYVNEVSGKDGLTLELRSRRDMVSPREAERLLELLLNLLETFCAGAAPMLADLSALTKREGEQLADWSKGAQTPAPALDLATLFEEVAARQPDVLAAVSDAGALTFAQLNRAADRLAAQLVAEGVAPGAAVGVAIRRSLESVVAVLGVLKAGAVYLPLDPDYPRERLAGMVEDAGAEVALATPDVVAILPAGIRTILFADGWPLVGVDADPPERTISPDARAYIIFTSGSTGRPKGVAMSHRGLVNLAWARRAHDPLQPGDRVLAAISIGFDVSLGQLLTPLLAGATVAVAGDIRGLSAEAFWGFMTRHGVTHVNSVPSFFASVLDAAPAATSLKKVMLGGEPLTGALATRLFDKLRAPVFNMYGPTEACIDATAFAAPQTSADAVLPIGRPLPNYTAFVLDDAQRLAPIGVAGELYLGGPSLAEGYVGQPELTAQRFVSTAFGRLYRTGDRAAWGEDGQLRFLGRADAQVKIRGHRVELGEIEVALAAEPGVAQAAVIARPDARGESRLLAYVVPAAGAPAPQAQTLRAGLARRLPSHMIPAAFTTLEALPLTLNGKLDERALPDPRQPAAAPAALATPTQKWLAEAFATLFPGAAIGADSHFFELGGHSLLATQLATQLRTARGVELPLRTLFEHPRLDDLALQIDALAPAVARPPLTPRPRPARIPLSPAQERLWFLAELDPQSAAYNIPVAVRIKGHLDADTLARALLQLTERHESLRTRFLSEGGLPYQEVLLERAPVLARLDLTNVGDAALRATLEREALRPFDLARDPLLRATLARTRDGDLLLLTIHHIVADGASMLVLLPELAALYGDADLPALPVQFADYALWRRDPAVVARDEASLDHWRAALAGAPEALALPTDFPRPEQASGRGDSVALDLGRELSQAVARFARDRRATPFIVLAAAWSALLARWSGEADVVIGAPLANRDAPETQGMVGFLVNTVALRARFDDAPDFAALVEQMRESVLEAQAHGDVPFERLVQALAPERSLARNPIFQAMFALQPAAPGGLAFGGLPAEPLALLEKVAKFDMTLNLSETPDGLSGALTYAVDLFTPETIKRMAAHFRRLLSAALAAPNQRYDRLPLIDEAERASLIAPGPSRPLRPATIPALFAERAAQQPDAEAVVFNQTVLSFAALDATANQLAHALSGCEGRPVAVMLARSEALVVAALGVMKARAVYLPIDPNTPDGRVAAILEDAAPATMLVDSSTAARAPTGLRTLDVANLDASPATAPSAALTPDATAYVIYTSGSTGAPKGVAVSHAALAALADARLAHDPIGPGDRVLAALSVGFDVSVGQLVTPLLSGATVVVSPPLAGLSGPEFWALMAERRITHLNSGPAFFDAALETAPPSGLALKRLMLGGETFPTTLARQLGSALPGVEIFNMYGPTEACIDATAYRFRGDEQGATLPIGRALPNYRVCVLDEAFEPVPDGLPGEIFIGGPTLAQGYLNRAQESQQRFVTALGQRLYRTGDRARRNAHGDIEFLGRLDTQIKIRGHRIEPDEVAAVLRREPGVASAAVVAHKRGGDTCLVAYVVASQTKPAELAARAAAQLPGYMVPGAIVMVPALPMTLNGKLDLKALPAPDFAAESEPTPPRDELDATLIDIWRALLEAPRVGIDDNFFRLGGHSLLALRLAAACKARLQIELPIAAIYRHQTLRALADAIRSGQAQKKHGPLVQLGEGPGLPVFGVHPVGGAAFGYIGLAELLAGRRPVYGVQASGLDAGDTLAATLDEMIESYMSAILAVQPRGPYAFIGHSFGGLVAFEITHRLERRGETVSRLVLSDTSPAGEPWTMELAERTAKRIVQLERERAGKTDEPIDKEQEQRVINIVANNMRLSESYTPPRITTPLTYLLARRGDAPPDNRRAYWESKSENPVAAAPLDCDHLAVLNRENAAKLAVFFD